MFERPLPRSLSDLASFFVLPTFLYLALFSCQGVHEKHCREFVDRRMDEEERENLITEFSGGDAPRGHTRTHPEHDG